MTQENRITYEQTGVNYSEMDPFKVMAQNAARSTRHNLQSLGYEEVEESRGESAYVWDEGDKYGAMVTEGLGTKNLVADATREVTGHTYYDAIAQDTVAMIVNDLVVVGARPKVVTAHFSVGSSSWFNDEERSYDLLNGFAHACNAAGATWGGGETPTLKGVLMPEVIELSGTAVGEISPKEHLTLGEKIKAGDAIIFLGSTGIHANGLTLARRIASQLPDGYATQLSDGSLYGEALLAPTPIYVEGIRDLLEQGIDVSYLINITGHGWRKLMRANREFSYVIEEIPTPQPIFDFIQEHSGNDDTEMYGNFNMGAGFAAIVDQNDVEGALAELYDFGCTPMLAGCVEEGPKRVVIEPKGITFSGDTLSVRS